MAQEARELKRTTAAQYLAVDDACAHKNEFRDGVVHAMGGATDDHKRISGSLAATQIYRRVRFGAELSH